MSQTASTNGIYTMLTAGGADSITFTSAGLVRIGCWGGGTPSLAGTNTRGRGAVSGADFAERTIAVTAGMTLYGLVGSALGNNDATTGVATTPLPDASVWDAAVPTLVVAAYGGQQNFGTAAAQGGPKNTTDATEDLGGPAGVTTVNHGGKGGNGTNSTSQGGGGGGGAGGPGGAGGDGQNNSGATGGIAGTAGAADADFPAGGAGKAGGNSGSASTAANSAGGGQGGNGSNGGTISPTPSHGQIYFKYTITPTGSDRRNVMAAM